MKWKNKKNVPLLDEIEYKQKSFVWSAKISHKNDLKSVVVKHSHACGIEITRTIKELSQLLFGPRMIKIIIKQSGSDYSVWLDDGSFRSVSDDGIFVNAMKSIAYDVDIYSKIKNR